MPINPRLKSRLLGHLGCSGSALSHRVRVLKNKMPLTTEQAVLVIAHKERIDISKYADAQTIDTVRSLLQQQEPSRGSIDNKKRAMTKKSVLFKISPDLPQVDAMLSTTIAKDLERMANIYPKLYVLENSLRIVIKRVLEKKYGKDWWDHCVKKEVKDLVDERKKRERTTPWHGKRGQHEIFYSDFPDLKTIISRNWDSFKEIFPTQPWIFQRLEELEHPRNVVAHNNPVSAEDMTRIVLYFSDWTKQLEKIKATI